VKEEEVEDLEVEEVENYTVIQVSYNHQSVFQNYTMHCLQSYRYQYTLR